MELGFYLVSFIVFLRVLFTGFSIEFFTTPILLQYIVFVVASVNIFNNKFEFKKALCLGFLVVFLNSFYWEVFYHVYEFQLWIPISLGWEWWYLRIPQWLRIVPAFFITRNFKITDRRSLMVGLIISFFLTYVRFEYHMPSLYIHLVHRMIALFCLVKTVYDAEVKDHTGVKYAW